MSPTEYSGLVQVVCMNNMRIMQAMLTPIPFGRDNCVIISGSDGKLERHPQSKSDLVMVGRDKKDCPLKRVLDHIGEEEYQRLFDIGPVGQPETKALNQEDPISHAFNRRELVYPDRILNAQLIIGSRGLFQEMRYRVLREMVGDHPELKRIREELKSQLSSYKKGIETGKYRHVPVYDRQLGVQYYDEDPTCSRYGFKHTFLRAVQRKMDLVTTTALQRGYVDLDEAVVGMPTNTCDRIEFFKQACVLPNGVADDAADAYSWFLREYHKAQEGYKVSGRPITASFDIEEFETHRGAVQGLLNLVVK